MHGFRMLVRADEHSRLTGKYKHKYDLYMEIRDVSMSFAVLNIESPSLCVWVDGLVGRRVFRERGDGGGGDI